MMVCRTQSFFPNERPYYFQVEERPAPDASFYSNRRTHLVTIDIDASGTGTFSDWFQYRGAADSDITTESQEATRTRTDSSVICAGTYNRFNTGAGVGDDVEFSVETRAIATQTRRQQGTVT